LDDQSLTRKGQKRREEILKAAKELFFEQGFRNTSVRQIAQSANTAMGTLYHHFPDKISILKVIVNELVGNLRGQIFKIADLNLRPEVGFALDLRKGYMMTLEDQRLSRLFFVVRSIPEIHEFSLENKRIRLRIFFKDRLSDQEIELIAISIQGIADSFFQQRYEDNLDYSSSFLADYIVKSSLRVIGFNEKKIDSAIDEMHLLLGNYESEPNETEIAT
jgi:AcrR family transcriptional regulator|tara:strand:+ start:5169 stop:5825 length:657 start_codon:yes stop_codon:yes gene_type:complete